MARSEARLKFSVWDGLDGHGPHAKLLYPVLLTEPTVNFAGVGAMRVTRWARKASLTTAETQKALAALVDSFHIVVDEDTEEVLVRTMIRNDEVWKQPFLLKGALQEALMTVSPRLRWVLAEELRKLPPRQPDGVSKSGKPIVYPDPHATADVLAPPGSEPPPETLSKGSRHPLDTLSTGSPVGLSTDSALRKTAGHSKGSPEGLDTQSRDNGVGEGVGEGEKGLVEENSSFPPTAAQPNATSSAQTLVGEWIDLCRRRPPGPVIGQTSKAIKAMLEEGIDPDDIRAGIQQWSAKGLHPAALPSVVNELMNARPTAVHRPNTAMDRIEGWQALKDTGTEPHLRALPPSTTRKAHN